MAYTERIRHPILTSRSDEMAEDSAVTETRYELNVLTRAIWFVEGVLMLLLGIRFVLSLLGANTTNGFAQFIYDTSHPFVAPFFNLFSYNNIQYGVSRFEIYTLVAMLVYAAIAWVLAALVNIGRP